MSKVKMSESVPCRECGGWFSIRKDGRVPKHRPVVGRRAFARRWCNGSDLRPKWRRALIGLSGTVVGYCMSGDAASDTLAHICLDIDGGPRIFVQADDPTVTLRIVEESREGADPGGR